jgi:type IV secretory pathway VirB10-like protein
LKEGLILDFAQSAFQAAEGLATKQNQGNNSSSLNFNLSTNNTQQAVDATLEKNLNIPDVLRLAQGAHISMTIMHPVFFQDVVSFVMRANHQ